MIPFYDTSKFVVHGIPIYPFSLTVLAAAPLGYLLAMRRAKALGLAPIATYENFVLWVLGCGFVAGHVLDVLLYHPEIIRASPLELVYLSHGLSSFGGIAGAVVGGMVFTRWKRLDPWVCLDLCTWSFPFAWALGRLGCTLEHDHPGARTLSPLAIAFPPDWPPGNPYGGPRYDLGLFELALTPLLMLTVVWAARRFRTPGLVGASLALVYAVLRFPLDFLRATDLPGSDPRYGGLTPGQWACLALVALGVWIFRTRLPIERASRSVEQLTTS